MTWDDRQMTWVEAHRKAVAKRDRCRRSKGKERCEQITCPRCNPVRVGRYVIEHARSES